MSKRYIWHKKNIEEVIDVLLGCKKREEVELLFDRILTPREINDISRRYKALRMLEEESSYSDVMVKTGLSSFTISRLSAKCGFGFRKSSGMKKVEKPKQKINNREYKTIKYKGIPVIKVKK